MGDRAVNKWAAGTSYGPILSQTDLYLLNTELELNPILEGKLENYQLQFHLVTGYTTSSARAPNGGDNVYGKDEPATLPRVSQLIVISRLSPWCTIIKRDTGVTIGDVCSSIFKDYTEHDVTDAEFAYLNGRMQEHVKRTAAANYANTQPQTAQAWGYYTPQAGPDRIRRVDWLRERVYFEGLTKDDNYTRSRLGFRAPNIFVMELTS
ncbi:hypothetical protein GALMADRAFT_240269 [Galerina marginata CBS 339.88]|uniref:DUF6699 domain-containing protein n=1 Tax=Galerina marginata (strain CBS 339.88) TaxID=685588 RepID=A0A067TSN3_GALM3|nr:hypothetical protein GALMADRAFT_240269 [Galerina marginata CBS 339.88]